MTSPDEIAELVKALQSKAQSQRAHAEGWDKRWAHTEAANARLLADLLGRAAAALEEVGRDAQRYRWLRFNSDNEFTDREDETPTLIAKGARFSCIGWDEKIDKAIDAAIDTEKNA